MAQDNEVQLVDRAVSRRSILKALGVGGSVAALSFPAAFGLDVVNAQTAGDAPQTILNVAATAEALAITHFYAGITMGSWFGRLPMLYQDYLRAALAAEQAHYNFLLANGAKPVTNKFFVPEGVLENLALYVAVTDLAEGVFIGAYLAATRRFAELNMPVMAEVAAQVMGVEAEHRALNRAMGISQNTFQGIANNIPLERPTVQQVSQAVPIAAAFLSGDSANLPMPFKGAKFMGPIMMPSMEQVNVVDANLDPVPTAITAFQVWKQK